LATNVGPASVDCVAFVDWVFVIMSLSLVDLEVDRGVQLTVDDRWMKLDGRSSERWGSVAGSVDGSDG
jgi:hypothetical protein